MADRHPAWHLIELEARSITNFDDQPPGEHAIELSKAISLKRIADLLESIISPAYDEPALRMRKD